MSGALAGAESGSLGSHRLSVRSDVDRPKPSKSPFAENLDYSNIDLTGDAEYRSVSEGDSRRITTVASAVDAFNDYLDNKENAVLALQDVDDETVKVLPYNHRWTTEYREMLYAKLKQAERGLERMFPGGPIPATLLTLTAEQTDSKGDPRPPGEVLNDLLNGFSRFRKVIDRATEGFKTEYLKVVEPHESGYPHLHVVIFGKADATLQNKVTDLWVNEYEIGGAEAHTNAVEAVRGRSAQINNVASYLMKYLGKTTVRKTGEQQQVEGYEAFSALMWVTGKRQFSASEGLSKEMSRSGKETERDWEFIGVAYGLNPGLYTGAEGQKLANHICKSAWSEPPSSAVRDGPKQVGLDPPGKPEYKAC